jgi:diguanylate cyclase (GGDEF)-like protein
MVKKATHTTSEETTMATSPSVERQVSEQRLLINRLMREKQSLQTELERLSHFRSLAYRDSLTGLHNRRYLDERLREECARVRRNPDYRFAILLFDVNDFKEVNDTKGHLEGDNILVRVAKMLRSNIREADVCARLGGDEFVILLHEADSRRCERVMQRLRVSLSSLQRDHQVRLSMGMAASDSGSTAEPSILLRLADRAMYRQKKAMKDRRQRRDKASERPTVSMPSPPREGSFLALATSTQRRRTARVTMRPIHP